jgi:muramoyltetrapeptide carboxypeptidase LdcA involved in peptidoglycan recycling
MPEVIRPPRLHPGDRVAVVAPSQSLAGVYPKVYAAGIATLRDTFGLEVVELPSVTFDPEYSYRHPELRAADLNAAFADDSIAGIIAEIGGTDSIRLLRHLDVGLAVGHPKVLMGYSDTATMLTTYAQAGLVTFNGPSVMAGFAQARHFPQLEQHVRDVLFEPADTVEYAPYPHWVDHYPNWHRQAGHEVGHQHPHDGWRWLQGSDAVSGRLFGGCIEVLQFLKGTAFWPDAGFFDDRVLFLETSEDKPPVAFTEHWLRSFGVAGGLDKLAGLLIGRPRDYTPAESRDLDAVAVQVLAEFGRDDLPVVSNLDFGHTDPQWILPNNVLLEIDVAGKALRLLEAAVS